MGKYLFFIAWQTGSLIFVLATTVLTYKAIKIILRLVPSLRREVLKTYDDCIT